MVAALAALLSLAPAAVAQETAPTVDAAPQPDPAAQPDPARSSPGPSPGTATPPPAPTAVEPAPAAITPEPQVSAAPATPPAAEPEPARRAASRSEPRRRQGTPRREASVAVVVAGDRPWERASALGLGGADDDRVHQAALGLLALCLASAGLQVLSLRLRRGAIP